MRGTSIPANLLDEIERELRVSCRQVIEGSTRLSQLLELHRLALESSLRRGRVPSVVELFHDARSTDEPRLTELVRALRATDGE